MTKANIQFTPRKGYVVIAPMMRETESGGIVLEAEPKANNNTEGVLRAVNLDDTHELKVGLVYSFVLGTSAHEKQVVHDGEQCWIIPETNLIAQVH